MKTLNDALHKKDKDHRPVSTVDVAGSVNLVKTFRLSRLIRLLESEPPLKPTGLSPQGPNVNVTDTVLSWMDPGADTPKSADMFEVRLFMRHPDSFIHFQNQDVHFSPGNARFVEAGDLRTM